MEIFILRMIGIILMMDVLLACWITYKDDMYFKADLKRLRPQKTIIYNKEELIPIK